MVHSFQKPITDLVEITHEILQTLSVKSWIHEPPSFTPRFLVGIYDKPIATTSLPKYEAKFVVKKRAFMNVVVKVNEHFSNVNRIADDYSCFVKKENVVQRAALELFVQKIFQHSSTTSTIFPNFW